MPKTLAVADGSFAAIQMPLAGDKANAQTGGNGAGLEELTIKPITDRLVDARTRLADAEVNVADHRTAIRALASYTPGMRSTERKRFIVPWEHITSPGVRSVVDGSVSSTDMTTGTIGVASLRIVGGVVLRRVGMYVRGVGFSALPATRPKVELCRMSTGGVVEVLATTTDAAASVAAFNAYHIADIDYLSVMVNSDYQYFLRLSSGGTGTGGTQYNYLNCFVETD